MKRLISLMAVLLLVLSIVPAAMADQEARAAFIDQMINTAEKTFTKANGRLQRAQYSGDIYVCKNYTVYLFRENRAKFAMEEFPGVELVIPDNLSKKESVNYAYGVEWKNVEASAGNPFYEAATFRYDESLSKEDNKEIAREFMMQVERGDFFQMSADYYYGVGAHSLMFISNYDPETKSVRWTDSNMKGEKKNGERYALVQYDAEKDIDWFVDAFCHKTRGATLYRLRDDIVYAN